MRGWQALAEGLGLRAGFGVDESRHAVSCLRGVSVGLGLQAAGSRPISQDLNPNPKPKS